jgi:tetratricopeptide (TPR) repeat protein
MATDQSHSLLGQAVGAKIRAARQALKYTQSQLAAKDFSVSYISAIERGQIRPSLRALEILAQRLGLTSTELIPQNAQNDIHFRNSIRAFNNDSTLLELELIEAQISILRGEAERAIARLEKITTKYLQDHHLTQQRYLLGWAYLDTAQFQKCQEVLIEAEKLAEQQKDHYRSLHIDYILGRAFAAMRDHTRALQTHQQCLKLLDQVQPHDAFFRCHLYNSLGQHYTNLNDFDAAINSFEQAIALTEELLTLQQLPSMYADMAIQYANAQDYALTALSTFKCLHLYSQRVDISLRSEIYHYLGRALMKVDQEQARAYLENALQRISNEQDLLTQASIVSRLAEWFQAHNQLEEAVKRARQAYELAKAYGDTIIAVEALLCLGRILYAQARYEEGNQQFVDGLEMLKRLNLTEEFSEQSASYAQLLSEQGKAQEAIAYYRLAFESRQKGRGI